jgi:hypothetical protein
MEQEGQRSHCAWGDDERANILNSSNYRGQNQGSMRSGSAGAASVTLVSCKRMHTWSQQTPFVP